MKTIVLTGGGTSGHVTPNIALIPKLKELGYTVHYIGSKNGIEKQLIQNEKVSYYPINSGKLRRYFDFKNSVDVFRVLDGFRQSISILRKIKPDVLFSKGGFVSCPVVWAAWICKIPVIIHESDITPGLANRLSIPFSKKVCFTFPESRAHLPQDKGVLTGIPIRQTLFSGDKNLGRKICEFDDRKPVLMIIGGSLGSENINKLIRGNIEKLLKEFNICHICGKGNVNSDLSSTKGYKQFEYVNDEQAHLYAIADAVISRAGATTIFELLALRKPNLLIPLSKNASRGDQILNAESFCRQGLSMVLLEENANYEALINNIKTLLINKNKFIENMEKNSLGNATQNIISIIEENS